MGRYWIIYWGWIIGLVWTACSEKPVASEAEPVTIETLARQFQQPPMDYRPYVWWHWMGSLFSKEGITQDLEAMKEAGIGGATIFHLSSAVQESHTPMENSPWPEQTYRSPAYWEAMRHAAAEAERLGLKIGLHNTPGYSTTGGPWITEERGMQQLVSSMTRIQGGQAIAMKLEKPELPIYDGWGSTRQRATFYRDVAVMALPEKSEVAVEEVLDVSAHIDTVTGLFNWQVPEGTWRIYRLGHTPTMANPHPLPDELIGKVLEADKMSEQQSRYHWQQVLDPLVEQLHAYIGRSFTHILIDSYEAGSQNWTPGFREAFQQQKGYDPLPYWALQQFHPDDPGVKQFDADYRAVINRLYIDNGWKMARDMIHQAGLQLYWEPYEGPFDTAECTAIADLPMGEFWTGGDGAISDKVVTAARRAGKRIVGAEAFTGRPEISQYTEDPAFLKHSADGSFHAGANRLFLHHWVHQPFDDAYQPGMGMGWWGTHFGRHQTWIKPGKAFFTYLTRCQMLLQESDFVSKNRFVLHRTRPDAELFFVINPTDQELTTPWALPVKGRTPQLWDADQGVIRDVAEWHTEGDTTYVNCPLQPDHSVFVVFPTSEAADYADCVQPAVVVEQERSSRIAGAWQVRFEPKLDSAFERDVAALMDFSQQTDPALRYFAGTAIYRKEVSLPDTLLQAGKRILLDLGEMHDLATVRVNGQAVDTLWYPPYCTDITRPLKSGSNQLEIAVTTNWANRLIGDEQYPADFEWGQDRGRSMGRAMKAFPDWFIEKRPRPSKERKAFLIWYYHRADSPLQPAGLIGPVRLIEQQVH